MNKLQLLVNCGKLEHKYAREELNTGTEFMYTHDPHVQQLLDFQFL